jgi:hypothetical protein
MGRQSVRCLIDSRQQFRSKGDTKERENEDWDLSTELGSGGVDLFVRQAVPSETNQPSDEVVTRLLLIKEFRQGENAPRNAIRSG